MKKFNIPFVFDGVKKPVTIYVGNPEFEHHPLQHQANWLQKERGASPVTEVMNSLEELHKIAKKNGVPFDELCTYALETASNYEKIPTSSEDSSENDLKNSQKKQ